jgi:hypothetical protein
MKDSLDVLSFRKTNLPYLRQNASTLVRLVSGEYAAIYDVSLTLFYSILFLSFFDSLSSQVCAGKSMFFLSRRSFRGLSV